MTVLVWALPTLAIAVGWALRGRRVRRLRLKLRRAEDLIADLKRALLGAVRRGDQLKVLSDERGERLLCVEADRDEWAGIARAWQDRAVAHASRPPVIVGTVAVDGEAAYAAAVEGIDRVRAQAGVAE